MSSPKDFLLRKKPGTLLQFCRYLLVGGLAAAVDTATLYVLNAHLGASPLVAGAAGFALGLLVNYVISIAWVFETSGRFKEEFALFALIGLGGLGWTELILWASIELAHLPVMAGKAAALILVLMWNFGMRKKLVFASATRSTQVPREGERSVA